MSEQLTLAGIQQMVDDDDFGDVQRECAEWLIARIAALEARCATLTAEVMHYTAGTPHPLEAKWREAEEDLSAAEGSVVDCARINIDLMKRNRELEAALAKEKGGWDAFYKLRRSVGEERYPGMTGEVTAPETFGKSE